MRGEGVIIFVLDTLPERKVILDAAQKAGDDNLLLLDVNNVITYNYNFLSSGIEDPDPDPAAVGKDVYGGALSHRNRRSWLVYSRHYP